MERPDLCERLWASLESYPDPFASAEENAALRAEEAALLARYAGRDALTQDEAREVLNWRLTGHQALLARAMAAVEDDRFSPPRRRRDRPADGRRFVEELIRDALASGDDQEALQILCPQGGGVLAPGLMAGSIILAACRPERFVPASSTALEAIRELGLLPTGPRSFRQSDWLSYLGVVRSIGSDCRLSALDVYRALAGAPTSTTEVWAYVGYPNVRVDGRRVHSGRAAVVHLASCPKCNNGAGVHRKDAAMPTSEWQRFESVATVRAWAEEKGYGVHLCGSCLGRQR
jgi:hypothetical protein